MNRDRFVEAIERKPQLSETTREMIIEKSLKRCSWQMKCVIVTEELAELSQCVSKYIRGCGDKMNLLEEMADVYICMKYLEKMFDLTPDEIQQAIDVKLIRDNERNDHCE